MNKRKITTRVVLDGVVVNTLTQDLLQHFGVEE